MNTMKKSLQLQHRGFELILDHGKIFTPVTLTKDFFERFALFLIVLQIRPKIKDFCFEYPVYDGGILSICRRDDLCELGYRKNRGDIPVTQTLEWYEVKDRLRKAGNVLGVNFNRSNGVSTVPYFASARRPVWCGTIGGDDILVVFDHTNLIVAKYHRLSDTSIYKRYPDTIVIRMANVGDKWISITNGYSPDCSSFASATTTLHEKVPTMHLKYIQKWYGELKKPFPDNVTSIDELKTALMEQFPF